MSVKMPLYVCTHTKKTKKNTKRYGYSQIGGDRERERETDRDRDMDTDADCHEPTHKHTHA